MNKILILGAGNAQIDLIEYCKGRNMEVHGCSYRHGDSGEALLDHFALINITDTEQIGKYIKDNEIGFIYSVGSDMAMPSVTKVAEELDLKHFVSSSVAYICNTKSELRNKLGTDFEGNIRYCVLDDTVNSLDLEFPLMLKPVDSQGQRGVFKVNNIEELNQYLPISLSYSSAKKAIAEEYIEGDEISVNTFSCNGKCVFKLISDRIVWDEYPGGIIHKHLIPSKYGTGVHKEKIENLVDRVLEKLGINDGPAYFQIKMKHNNEPVLVEVTPRLDGCHMWRLIKYTTGTDLLDLSVKKLLGEDVSGEYISETVTKKGVLEFMCQAPGTIVNRDVFNIDDSDFYRWYYKNGDTVSKMNGFMEKCGYKIYSV